MLKEIEIVVDGRLGNVKVGARLFILFLATEELYLYAVPATNLLFTGEPNESHDGALWWW